MQRRTIILAAIGALLIGAALLFGYSLNNDQEQVANTYTPALTKYEVGPPDANEILELVNAERAKAGVAPLTIDTNVQKSAQLKATDMYERDYFSHKVKGTDKVLTPEMNDLLVASCSESSENIRENANMNNSQITFDAWKNSKPHYAAMLRADYTKTGLGVAMNKIVQHFCVAK